MAPIDLQPPLPWQDEVFPLGQKHFKDLQRYANAGTVVPLSLEEFQHDLGLNSSAMEEFKGEFSSLVDVCSKIRTHCLSFKRDILPQFVEFATFILDYANEAQPYFDALYSAIKYMTETDGISQSDVDYAKMVLNIVTDKKSSQLREMNRKSDLIISTLLELKQNLNSDKLLFEKDRDALQVKKGHNPGQIRRLKPAVETLSQLAKTGDEASDKGEELFWVPLVGYIPKAVLLDDPIGKGAMKFIFNYLSADTNTRETSTLVASLEAVHLQNDLMISHLGRMVELIQPVTDTIRSLRDPFEAVAAALDGLTAQAQVPGAKLDTLLSANCETVTEKWKAVGSHADTYRSMAYVDFIGAEILL